MDEDKKIFVVNSKETVETVLKLITENHRGGVAVVDDDNRLLGVVSDGDIRRGLVHGNTIFTPINKLMNVNCIYLEEKDKVKAEEIFAKQISINIIPIVNEQNQLVDVAIREL